MRRLLLAFVVLVGCSRGAADDTGQQDDMELTSANSLDGVYLRMDLLAPDERSELDRLVETGVLAEKVGAFAIVFPDDRKPVAGAEAIAMITSGQASTFSFSGLPNSLLGSMSLGKYTALVNHAPVVAVHTGFGNDPDMGVQSQGPKAFFVERPLNKAPEPYDDDAIRPIRDVLVGLDPASSDGIRLMGYCLGAFKAANLTKWIALEKPALLAKTDVAVFGVGVDLPVGLRHVYQDAGNLDVFGRINSTAILATDVEPGRFHPLRDDVPTGLHMVPFDEAWKRQAWLDLLARPESLLDARPDADVAAKLARDAATVRTMQIEVALSAGLPTDVVHENRLHARATEIDLATYIVGKLGAGVAPDDIRKDAHVLDLRMRIDAYLATAAKVDAERTPASDTYEYQVYKERLAAAAAAVADAGKD